MGLLDKLTSSDTAGTPEAGGMLGHVLDIVNNPTTGGFAGLVQQFHTSGLGGVIASWIGTGANQPIAAEQLTRVLGPERLRAVAAKLGLPPETVATQLSTLLPQVVDRLTPHGTVPQGNLLDQSLATLRTGMPTS